MGSLLGLLRKPQDFDTNFSATIDFENVEPTKEEEEMYNLVKNEFAPAASILASIKQYNGVDAILKKKMTDTNDDEVTKQVWELLTPLIRVLKSTYDLSKQMEIFLPKLLCSLSDGKNTTGNFENKQALAELFSRILDFSMEFDLIKINKPAIVNDFTFYKRTISKSNVTPGGFNLIVEGANGEMISKVGLFISNSYPFMNLISRCTIEHFSGGSAPSLKEVTESLATLARLCRYMVETPSVYDRFQNQETKLFCTRVMVSLIVLYDNVHAEGIFVKGSPIDVRSYVKFLKEQQDGVQLLHIIKHISKHFNNSTTPNSIKVLFD